MTPTTLTLQMPFQAKEESSSSLERTRSALQRTRSATAIRSAQRRRWRAAEFMIRQKVLSTMRLISLA